MSAIVCGKRSFFEDLPAASVSKRIRSSSSSPLRLSPPRPLSSSPPPFLSSSSSDPLIKHLAAIFPYMDKQILERALDECGNDLDSAIKSLYELRIGSVDKSMESTANQFEVVPAANIQNQTHDTIRNNGEVLSAEDLSAPKHFPADGEDWIDLFVKEMMTASNMDDARVRVSKALEVLEQSISARAGAEAAKSFHQENMMLKEQMEALIQENKILKRAVSIQHEHQKVHDTRNQELQRLKQLVSQYQDQLRTLEVNNYALTMHLKQAQQNSSIPGRFNPDVF